MRASEWRVLALRLGMWDMIGSVLPIYRDFPGILIVFI